MNFQPRFLGSCAFVHAIPAQPLPNTPPVRKILRSSLNAPRPKPDSPYGGVRAVTQTSLGAWS